MVVNERPESTAAITSSWHQKASSKGEEDEMVDRLLGRACVSLGLDLAEVWNKTTTGASRFTCVRRYSTEGANNNNNKAAHDPTAAAAAAPDNNMKRPTSLSRLLCSRLQKSKAPLWLTPTQKGVALHSHIPLHTAVAVPIYSYESQEEYCVLFFAYDQLENSPDKLDCLKAVSKDVVAALVAGSCPEVTTPSTPSDSAPAAASQAPEVDVEKDVMGCSRPRLQRQSMSLQMVQWDELDQVNFLVNGGSGAIFTATLDGKHVVVKNLQQGFEKNKLSVKELQNEIHLMQQLDHPHIAKCLGTGTGGDFVVMELLDGGSLNQRLGFVPKYSGVHKRTFQFKDTKRRFSYPQLLKYAYQLADAMRYLHDEAIPGYAVLHRDLKPDNIGFTSDGTLKLIDFGVAKCLAKDTKERANHVLTGGTGSMRYMAPEVAFNKKYDEKADVYSFSFILWEMATLEKPFKDYTRALFCQSVFRGGKRPPVKSSWPKGFVDLLQSCWHANPCYRPVLQTLEGLMREAQETRTASPWALIFRRQTCSF